MIGAAGADRPRDDAAVRRRPAEPRTFRAHIRAGWQPRSIERAKLLLKRAKLREARAYRARARRSAAWL
jgi:hypothetical protein